MKKTEASCTKEKQARHQKQKKRRDEVGSSGKGVAGSSTTNLFNEAVRGRTIRFSQLSKRIAPVPTFSSVIHMHKKKGRKRWEEDGMMERSAFSLQSSSSSQQPHLHLKDIYAGHIRYLDS